MTLGLVWDLRPLLKGKKNPGGKSWHPRGQGATPNGGDSILPPLPPASEDLRPTCFKQMINVQKLC